MVTRDVDWSRQALLVAATICTGFAAGYQPIAVLGWVQFLLLLRYLESGPRSYRHWLITWIAQSIGLTFAMAGSFNDPVFRAETIAAVLVVSLVVKALEVLSAWVYVTIGQRFPHRIHLKILAYPITFTGIWFFWGLVSPTGSYAHPATSQWTVSPIIQLTSLFGLDGIIFLMTWSASMVSTAIELLWKPVDHYDYLEPDPTGDAARSRSKARRHLRAWAWSLFFALVYGGANMTVFVGDQFYQQTLQNTIGSKETLSLGCLITGGVMANASTSVWTQTENLASIGNNFVIWSEEGLDVYGSQDETNVLTQASSLALQYHIYLGVTYKLIHEDDATLYDNIFTLIQPDGTTGFRYRKRHPVPLVENGCIPGTDPSPPYIDTPYGRVGGAICFDMDFPLWMKGAGQAKVDLFLQPSWTWGPIGQLHAFDSAIRAVENGFGLFRCSSGGISGYWDARYGIQSLTYTNHNSNGPAKVVVPKPSSRPVLYPWFGFIFGWLCLIGTIGYFIALFGPAQRAIRRATERIMTARGIGGGGGGDAVAAVAAAKGKRGGGGGKGELESLLINQSDTNAGSSSSASPWVCTSSSSSTGGKGGEGVVAASQDLMVDTRRGEENHTGGGGAGGGASKKGHHVKIVG